MKDLMTQAEVAEYLGLSERTLQEWRSKRRGPAFIRISKNEVRYLADDIRTWVNQRRSDPKDV